jgi:hypothetical protein
MFDHTHYVPILKGKMGERGALETLTPAVKSALTPLIEVPPIPWDHDNETPAKTVDAHIARIAQQLVACWGQTDRLFLDFNLLDPAAQTAQGVHALKAVLDDARTLGLMAVPVVGLARGQDYENAVQDAISQDARGLCLRLDGDDYEDPIALTGEVDDLLTRIGTSPADADLVIDLAAIGTAAVHTLTLGVIGLIATTPHVTDWRSLTVAATGFPQDMSRFSSGTTSATPRTEWQLWLALRARRAALARVPTFGDYAISHPDLVDIDPRLMQPSATIRYTADDDWLVVKGKSFRRNGAGQFHTLSATLANRSEFSGAGFSWGDDYIATCATGAGTPGNLMTWRRVGTSHHLAFVVSQIASQPAI